MTPANPTKPLRAIVYVRLSSHRADSDPNTSPKRQRESCKAYALAKSWGVLDVVEDLDVSGSDKGTTSSASQRATRQSSILSSGVGSGDRPEGPGPCERRGLSCGRWQPLARAKSPGAKQLALAHDAAMSDRSVVFGMTARGVVLAWRR